VWRAPALAEKPSLRFWTGNVHRCRRLSYRHARAADRTFPPRDDRRTAKGNARTAETVRRFAPGRSRSRAAALVGRFMPEDNAAARARAPQRAAADGRYGVPPLTCRGSCNLGFLACAEIWLLRWARLPVGRERARSWIRLRSDVELWNDLPIAMARRSPPPQEGAVGRAGNEEDPSYLGEYQGASRAELQPLRRWNRRCVARGDADLVIATGACLRT